MTELVSVTRVVVDTEDNLRKFLEARHADGRLVTPIDRIQTRQSATDPNRWALRATFLEPAPKPSVRYRMKRFRLRHPVLAPLLQAAAFGLVVTVGLAGVLFALFETVRNTVDASTLRAFGGVMIALGVLIAVTCLRGGGGRHSGHNGKGWHYTDCK